MSLNDNSNWNGKKDNQGAAPAQQGATANGLIALFQQTSMTSDNRNLKDVTDVANQVSEFYKTQKKSTTSPLQQGIIPDVEAMTPSISPQLPGLCFYRTIEGQMYVMGVLFSNNNLAISTEQINVQGFSGVGGSQRISIPITPVDYANGVVIEGVRNHYKAVAAAQQVSTVHIINMIVVDLEMYNHSEIADAAARIDTISNWITREWEESILVKAAEQAVAANIAIPSPFKDSAPYGANKAAEARVSVVAGRVNTAKQLSPANMEVIVSTMNPNNNSQSLNSKEIARIKATVSLKGVSLQEHQANMMANNNMQQQFMQMMGMAGANAYPNGYRPLRPVITLDQVQPGEQMNYNGGLAPYFFGLFTLMCTNNNYVFAEPLRRVNVGARGNLADLEVRINQLLQGSGIPAMPGRLQLTEKNISDTDVVNQWIRQNVAPHATFQTNLVLRGVNGSINNFLLRLASTGRTDAVNTVVATLDAISNGAASTLISRNQQNGKGWTKEKPILHRTPEIAVNGLATYVDKQLNTLELDEMMLGHVKGKNGMQAIGDYLRVQYGTENEEFKSRAQKLRIQLNESIFDGAVHINSFSQVHIWDPQFMQLLGECMQEVGAFNVANNLGSFRTSNLVYAPGAGLATYASVGNNQGGGVGAAVTAYTPFA